MNSPFPPSSYPEEGETDVKGDVHASQSEVGRLGLGVSGDASASVAGERELIAALSEFRYLVHLYRGNNRDPHFDRLSDKAVADHATALYRAGWFTSTTAPEVPPSSPPDDASTAVSMADSGGDSVTPQNENLGGTQSVPCGGES